MKVYAVFSASVHFENGATKLLAHNAAHYSDAEAEARKHAVDIGRWETLEFYQVGVNTWESQILMSVSRGEFLRPYYKITRKIVPEGLDIPECL